MSKSTNVTIYTLQELGLTKGDSIRIFQALCRYITPYHVQVIRPIILKGKLTTTTLTMRAMSLKSINDLVQVRLINPKRSKLDNWIELARIINFIEKKDKK